MLIHSLKIFKTIVANGKHDSKCEAEVQCETTEKSVSLFLLIILTGSSFYAVNSKSRTNQQYSETNRTGIKPNFFHSSSWKYYSQHKTYESGWKNTVK